MDIYAHPHHMTEWSAGKIRSRWDYDCPDYTLEDMKAAGDRLFARCLHMLRPGDIVYTTDAANRRATLIVNVVDTTAGTLAWDIDVAHSEQIVTPKSGLVLRWRGPRGGGWCIVNTEGEVMARDLPSKEDGARRLANMTEARAA